MLELISEHACFGGVQRYYRHQSSAIGLPMRFGVFLPAQAADGNVPALFCLAGLTCNEETFATKAGAQRQAAALGLMLITPDTSPRGANVPGESDAWDLGVGAGFYVDATEAPWRTHYRMYSYLLELHALVLSELPADADRVGIIGHSMGGHGALVLALRNPALFKSVSAMAPISAPTQAPWGDKAFSAYLGPRSPAWDAYDASVLMAARRQPFPHGILIDQGLADKFLPDQLFPEAFEAACAAAGQPLTLRRHAGYDHGYYFIATVIDDHLKFHHEALISQGVTP
ncbi:S-formylglutathione hydrolase [Janthinobacterium sp. 67]|uniref:S-formylglutathione hydrolase n=1 Tax=unclassified Janthinobacterium TaxID=2610881 RepID=UPI000956CE47|nr:MULTISPECIES: S-formylglutathione hydrolase [unclassified Janthinobacterium]PJJ06744.1 S-formylglutathione hydrolase [Janthinobacterium sp. 67]SIR94061.1 S-formylglutathione hydrolase [Janthinobacterium sp. TND4EL3]